MYIEITWHLILVILIQIGLIVFFFRTLDDWIPLFPMVAIFLSIFLWAVYGGIVWW